MAGRSSRIRFRKVNISLLSKREDAEQSLTVKAPAEEEKDAGRNGGLVPATSTGKLLRENTQHYNETKPEGLEVETLVKLMMAASAALTSPPPR